MHHKCRCENCTAGRAKRNYRRLQLKAYGRYDTGLVDIEPVREHVLLLGEYGIGYKRVARLAGFKSSTPVRTIIWGRQEPGPRYGEMQKRIKRETAERVLRVRPSVEFLADGMSIPARGAHRRVQALVNRGWSLAKVAGMVGMGAGNFHGLMHRDRILVSTYKTICDVYERCWDQAPPEWSHRDRVAASRARRHAAERGWVPPLAWDDIDLDPAPDLGGEPDEVLVDEQAVELAVSGLQVRLRPLERRAAVERLHACRWSDARIAEQIGCRQETVLRIRAGLGLPGIAKTDQIADARAVA